jgi:alkylation response protein AidB-like acyl-CoA dehydrogenase
MTLTEEFDASLTADARDFLQRARLFAENVIAPAAKAWEYARRVPLDALQAACREGFAGVELARDSGGLGLPFSAKMRMAEELSKQDLAFTFSLIQHHNATVRIAESGTAAAAEKLVAKMLAGAAIGCTAMSESGAGSDFSAIRTSARKVADGWLLDGEKAWITNASVADVFLTYAQTDPALGSKGIACFIVTSDTPGFFRQPAYELHGAHAIGVGGYTMKDCFVADALLLYPSGEGFKEAMQGVNRARVHVTAMNAGILDASLSTALGYAAQRQAFGKALLDFQGLSWSLVDVATELEAMRLLAYRGARLIEQGTDAQEAAAMAKKFGNDRTLKGIEACMQAMGANGLRADHPLARHLAAAKLLAYTDGTIEMMNERLAHLLRKRTTSN